MTEKDIRERSKARGKLKKRIERRHGEVGEGKESRHALSCQLTFARSFPIYLESSSALSTWLTLALSCSSIISKCFFFFQAKLDARPL